MPVLAILSALLMEPDPGSSILRNASWGTEAAGAITVELFVGPDASVEACRVVYQSGSRSAAERFCEKTIGKKTTAAARNARGEAAYGTVYTGRVRSMGPPDMVALPARIPDLELAVPVLPEGSEEGLSVGVTAYVNADGRLEECVPSSSAPAAYGSAACEQLAARAAPVRRNRDGEAVGYVTSFLVAFVHEDRWES